MKFTADFSTREYRGNQICTADSIGKLISTLEKRGFDFKFNPIKEEIIEWIKTTEKKYYRTNIVIRRGELEMTEYMSL